MTHVRNLIASRHDWLNHLIDAYGRVRAPRRAGDAVTRAWSAAVSRARAADGYAIPAVGQRPAPAPAHLVTVTEQHDDATITYAATCTCGHYVRTDTEGETRYAARLHAAGTVFAGGRPQFPMRLVINGKVQ